MNAIAERKRKVERALIAAIMLLALSTYPAYAEPNELHPEADSFNEYGALIKAVPHKRLRIWPLRNSIGMELLVERGVTDKQLAKLVRWYVDHGNATLIYIFDLPNTPPGGGGNAVMAQYADGTLIRFLHRHSDEEELIGQRTIQVPPQKTE